jgi:hypothetical protein
MERIDYKRELDVQRLQEPYIPSTQDYLEWVEGEPDRYEVGGDELWQRFQSSLPDEQRTASLVIDYERETREERMARQSGDPDYETIRQVNLEWRKGRQAQMDQGPPRDQATPYRREIIGEFSLKAPRVVKGNDRQEHTIPAGRHSIVGAVSLDGNDLRDAAIVYDTGKVSPQTGKRIFIPEPLHIPELAAAQKKGLVAIDEPHEQKVAEAVARAAAPERKVTPLERLKFDSDAAARTIAAGIAEGRDVALERDGRVTTHGRKIGR